MAGACTQCGRVALSPAAQAAPEPDGGVATDVCVPADARVDKGVERLGAVTRGLIVLKMELWAAHAPVGVVASRLAGGGGSVWVVVGRSVVGRGGQWACVGGRSAAQSVPWPRGPHARGAHLRVQQLERRVAVVAAQLERARRRTLVVAAVDKRAVAAEHRHLQLLAHRVVAVRVARQPCARGGARAVRRGVAQAGQGGGGAADDSLAAAGW
eukprot:3416338-Prymnesium_polylepis.1